MPGPRPLPGIEDLVPDGKSSVPLDELHEIRGKHGSQITATKYLLAYDGTEDARLALEWLRKHVHSGDHVILCSVLPFTANDIFGPVSELGADFELKLPEPVDVFRKLRARELATLESQADVFQDQGAATTVHVVHGDPRYGLCQVGDYHEADFIVMGRRHLTGLNRFMSGASVSSYVAQHCTQSVIVVKQ